MGENVSALAISERCHCYGIILKSPKRHPGCCWAAFCRFC
jgi:hypothetical protein